MPHAFDQAHFGHTLRVAMARKNYTQEDLAEAIAQRTGKKPAQTTISYWLRTDDKAKTPHVKMLPALLEALDLTWDDIDPDRTAETPADPLRAPKPVDLVRVPSYLAGEGRLERTTDTMAFDKRLAGTVPPERLGGLMVPAGWDNMIRYVEPGDRMLLEVYASPVSLHTVFHEGRFRNGVYLLSFTAGLHLHRLQELPGALVMVLSDNAAYRDVELNLKAGDAVTLHARVLAAEGPA